MWILHQNKRHGLKNKRHGLKNKRHWLKDGEFYELRQQICDTMIAHQDEFLDFLYYNTDTLDISDKVVMAVMHSITTTRITSKDGRGRLRNQPIIQDNLRQYAGAHPIISDCSRPLLSAT